jgi:RNA polymerase sigma-70 factor (ECF subfamily)
MVEQVIFSITKWTEREMDDLDKRISEEIAVLWTNAQPAIAAFVSSIVPNFQDADDIIQQVAVAIIKNYGKYDKDRSFVAWGIGIAKNQVLMYRRKNSKGKLIFSEISIQAISEVYEQESHRLDDIKHALSICIKKLKGRAKRLLEMRYVSEQSIPRIAQRLGMNPGAVYTSFHRIRLALRDCINQQISPAKAD